MGQIKLEMPDYLTDADAVLKDKIAAWRHGQPPDYSSAREFWKQTKQLSHENGSLAQLVENLVKNWEIEASFKTNLDDWRTIDRGNYTFSVNGGPPQTAEHMLHVGTYNAILSGAGNQYYSAEHSDFSISHKTFKSMMPVFAWEVIEVYSGPPQVAFRWRHWGEMQKDYTGFNDKGHSITINAHGGLIEIHGVTVASVDESIRLQKVETWFDPMQMFRQIAAGSKIKADQATNEHDYPGSNSGAQVAGVSPGPVDCPFLSDSKQAYELGDSSSSAFI